MTPRRFAFTLAVGLTVAGCGGTALPSPTPTADLEPTTYTLCPPSNELPAAEENDAAIAVVAARLDALGVSDAEVSIGTCLDVMVEGVPEDDALRAVLFGSGLADFVAVPPDRAADVVPGLTPPDDLLVVIEATPGVVAGAAPEAAAVDIRLGTAATSLLEAWTTTHVGESLALVLDGRVVGSTPIDGPNSSGTLRIPVSSEGLTPAAVAALLAGGPLPGDWRQPDAPQG